MLPIEYDAQLRKTLLAGHFLFFQTNSGSCFKCGIVLSCEVTELCRTLHRIFPASAFDIFRSSNPISFPTTDISAPEVSKIAEQFYATCSCIIRTIEPHVNASEDDLKNVVENVTEMERQGGIGTWKEQTLPDAIIKDLPTPG